MPTPHRRCIAVTTSCSITRERSHVRHRVSRSLASPANRSASAWPSADEPSADIAPISPRTASRSPARNTSSTSLHVGNIRPLLPLVVVERVHELDFLVGVVALASRRVDLPAAIHLLAPLELRCRGVGVASASSSLRRADRCGGDQSSLRSRRAGSSRRCVALCRTRLGRARRRPSSADLVEVRLGCSICSTFCWPRLCSCRSGVRPDAR